MSGSIESRGYAHPEMLVTTEWVAEHAADPNVRLVESDEDILLYEMGHINGAIKLDWQSDLQDQVRRDFLDHYAIYTIAEKDLNAFLDKHFASPGETLDSFSERSPADPKLVGKPFGPLAWIVTADTVSYSYTAGNGGAHKFYHDTKTGLTYQSSAYW